MLGLAIFLFIYGLYIVFISCYMSRLFKRLSYLSKPEVTNSEEFPGFTRDDYKNWSRFHFTIGAIFLVPIRTLITFPLIFIGTVSLFISSFLCCNFSFSKINLGFKWLSNWILIIIVRSLMFVNGIYKINHKFVTPKAHNMTYFEDVGEVPYASIICNHTSFVDIYFFLSQPKSVGFISNAGVKKYPFVGQIAQMLQCIFVDRKNPNSTTKCLNDLKERAQKIKNSPNSESILFW